jgi:hypothetical protein
VGLTEFLRVCLFVAAVVIVALAAFWLVSEGGKRGALSPTVVKIAVVVIVLAGVVALVLRFAGNVVPR